MTTLENILKASANGFPEVICDHDIKYATSRIGKIVCIKDNGKHSGVGVKFPGIEYDVWFNNIPDGTDKRTRYLHNLTLLEYTSEWDKGFSQGYACACANFVRDYGQTTESESVFAASFMTIEEMQKLGVSLMTYKYLYL